MVSVRFLGSGDAFGSGGRFQACILVSGSNGPFLLDCGASSLIAMKAAAVDPSSIPLVVVSHLHGDHFGGLPFLVLDGQFSRRASTLRVAGPPGISARLPQAMEALFPGSPGAQRRFALEVEELPERVPVAFPECTVTAYPVDHASGAIPYAYRVEVDGRVIAYSGDTAWSDSLLEAADGADLFICEAYYRDKSIPYHLDFRTLESKRDELRCDRIILTHMNADMLPSPPDGWERAHDGMTVEL
ncbi:MAG TPA: MBL fold metallo-hydrolase [Tepidiformaceae bacterium]|nr:MBL fold metallo-hydrolase [Tepidiformaceae bacterium]